jgi:tetratricopeptide (TPR) repeat protein/predicted Ser/Thr protein kinase
MADPAAVTLRTKSGASTAVATAELERGATLGRYVILKRIGQGGMGVVYLAFDGELERRVAIKVLRPHAAEAAWGGEVRVRLLREAQAIAQVSHPNVVAVYDVGTFDGQVFLALEYVDGETLRQWLSRTKASPRAVVAAYALAGRGLEAAHGAGILHRDFKPENVLIDETGRVKVLDFGLARLDEPTEAAPEEEGHDAASIELCETGLDHRPMSSGPLTRKGMIMGTPAYMAPEQLQGEAATARSDQFAFCVALYEALHGERPFDGDTITLLDANIRADRVRPVPRGVKVPSRVRRVLLRGLRGDPAARHSTMTDLLRALDDATRARTRWLLAGAAGAALLAVGAAVALRPGTPAPCTGAADEIGTAWSPSSAEEMRRAFVASGNARGEDAFAHTRPLLDRYAASWIGMHTDTCLATRVRGEQSEEALDLRMACLRQRERELKATVTLLEHADSATVDGAVVAAARLTPLDTCVDLAALRAPFATPKTEAQRRAVDDLRRKLVDVQALDHAGRWAESYASAATLVEDATRADYAPIEAEALYYRGYAEYELGKHTTTSTLFQAALEGEVARHDVVVAQAWVQATSFHAAYSEFADAHRTAQLAAAAVRRSGDGETLRAALLAAQGWLAYDEGAQVESLELAKESLALRERALGPTHPDTLESRSDVADRLWDRGDMEAALAVYQETYRARATLLGDDHPSTLRSLDDIMEVRDELGDHAAALELSDRILTHVTAPMRKAEALVARGRALVGVGRVDEGLRVATEGIDALGALDLADTASEEQVDLARALVMRGADDRAEAQAIAALPHLVRPGELAVARGVRALCELRRGAATAAVTDASAALGEKDKVLGERADIVPLLARGQAYLLLRRPADAAADLERAVALGERYQGDAAIRADARFALARAIVANEGDLARASELASRAASAFDAAGLTETADRVRRWAASSVTSRRG